MIEWFHPGLIFIFGAVPLLFLKGRVRDCYLLLIPVLAFASVVNSAEGTYGVVRFMDFTLTFGRVDKLSLAFGYVFTIAAFIGVIYGLHKKKRREPVAALLYVGGSLGAIFAGDLLTLFIFWELMAFSSVFLIWFRGGKKAQDAGFRYIMIHIAGGLVLLGGIIIYYAKTGSIEFNALQNNGLGFYLILIGFLVNAAVPPFSAWLSDAYPEATITGAVFMCAFTTKTAVYVLVRGYPGTEILITLGVIMALYGAIFAILENDCRRLLAYHIISQVGYMVCGIGMGTSLAINGAVSHAVVHILYKSLLFMGAGAIIYVTGKRKLTELGGLYKYMPITLTLFIIGALSTSAFPLFSAFVSKSMIISAAAHDHRAVVVLILTLVGAGTCLYTGLKLPYFIFFGEDKGIKAKEPPFNMLLAMVIAAVLCVAIGVFPGAFYKLLPFSTHYAPYTADHVTGALGLLGFTALAFFFFKDLIAPKETISLDTDWFYRLWGNAFLWLVYNPLAVFSSRMASTFFEYIPGSLTWFSKNPLAALKIGTDTILSGALGPDERPMIKSRIDTEKAIYPSDIIKHWPIGSTVLWVTIFLLIYLLVYFL